MKNILLIITTLFLALNNAYASLSGIYGVYESTHFQDLYGKKELSPELKEAIDSSHMTITVNEHKIILTIGKSEPEAIDLNYVIVKNNFILAFDKESMQEMYYPIYIKNNILYTAGQRFKKTNKESNKAFKRDAKQHAPLN